MTFLQLTDIHGDEVHINVSSIDSYGGIGGYTKITCNTSEYHVMNTVNDIKTALSEVYCTSKEVRVTHESRE